MKESNSRHATDGAAPGRLAFLHITEGVAAHTSFPSISLSLSPMLYTIQMYLIPAVHTIPAHTSLIQPLIPFYTHTRRPALYAMAYVRLFRRTLGPSNPLLYPPSYS